MELNATIASHQRWTREPPLHRAVAAGVAGLAASALAASVLLIGPARAAVPGAMCRNAGHSASAAEIVYEADAASTAVDENLSWMQQEFDRATPASPAAWRLREDLDRLHGRAELLTQLRQVASVRGDATPGSLAQFRAQEKLDLACDAIATGD
jgi:hypothetical protein